MRTSRISVFAAIALVVAACGTTGPDASDTAGTRTTPQPDPTTTTILTTTTTSVVEPTVPSTTTTMSPATTTTSVQELVEVFIYLTGGADANPANTDCSVVSPVIRLVRPPATLRGAMEALLAGPTDEEIAAGFYSWFSPEVGWELESAIIRDGVAYIDFAVDSPFINNASTSCGSASFLGQLIETATQFPTVDNAVFSIGGDADVFYQWLQRDTPVY